MNRSRSQYEVPATSPRAAGDPIVRCLSCGLWDCCDAAGISQTCLCLPGPKDTDNLNAACCESQFPGELPREGTTPPATGHQLASVSAAFPAAWFPLPGMPSKILSSHVCQLHHQETQVAISLPRSAQQTSMLRRPCAVWSDFSSAFLTFPSICPLHLPTWKVQTSRRL